MHNCAKAGASSVGNLQIFSRKFVLITLYCVRIAAIMSDSDSEQFKKEDKKKNKNAPKKRVSDFYYFLISCFKQLLYWFARLMK